MYAKVLKDSAASIKAHVTRRKNTKAIQRETHRLLSIEAGLPTMGRKKRTGATKTDTNHIGSVAASLGIV